MRHKKVVKRKILSDKKFQSERVAKFINYVMREGKKTLAEKIVYEALDEIKEKTGKDPLEVWEKAMANATPTLEVRGRRIGGANFQIPFPVSASRGFTLSSRWILEAVRSRKGKSTKEKLVEEILLAYKGEGAAIKKKEDVHRMAEANRAFARFARVSRK